VILLKIKHFLGKRLFPMDHRICLELGCDEYHGNSPSQLLKFEQEKHGLFEPFRIK